MATIDLILRAINKASGPLKDVADAAEKAAGRIDALNDRIGKTDRALSDLEGAARLAEAGMKGAGREADALADKLRRLNEQLDDLDRTVTAKVKVDVDRSALSKVAASGGGGRRGTLGGLAALLGPGGVGAGAAFGGLPLLAQGGVVGAVASALPFIATALSGAIIGALGAGLTGLGIAGALTTGTAPKALAPGALTAAQLRALADQQRLAALLAGTPGTPGRPGRAASPAAIASAQASVLSAQAALAKALGTSQQQIDQLRLTAAQDRLAQLMAGTPGTPGRPGRAASPASITAARAALASAQGRLTTLQQQQAAYNDFQKTYQQQLKAKAAFANLSSDAQNSLAQIGKSFVPVMISIFNTADSVLKKLTPVFSAVVKSISGPFQILADTLINAFAQPAVTQSIQDVGKAFVQFLTAFTPQIPGIVKALANGVDAMAQAFIQHPDMIKAMSSVVAFLFRLPGYVFDALAALTRVAHWLATGLPHEVSIGIDFARTTIIHFGHDTESEFDSLRHHTANIFDGIRHDIANVWDLVWHNTIDRLNNGINDFNGIIDALPGQIVRALGDAGKVLYDWGAGLLRGLLHGFDSVWNSVKNFFTSLPGKILGWLGIHSPPQWSIDAGMHIAHGIGIGMQNAQGRVSSAVSALRNNVVGGLQNPGGPAAGSATQAQDMAMKMAALVGWTGSLWTALNDLVMRESGWSMTATNPTSGAYGIAQGITGPSWYYQWPGGNPNTLFGQLTGLFDYIASRYGNPAAAWAHETNVGWYAGGTGGAAPGWAWVGERGAELVRFSGGETVLPHSQSMAVAGYAAGTGDAGLLRALEASLKTANTVAALHADAKVFFKLIADNFTGSARRWRDKMVERQVAAATATLNAMSRVASRIADAKAYQQSVQQGLSGYARVQDMSIGGAYVGGKLQSGAQYLNTQLRDKLATLRAFSAALKKLVSKHAPASLIQSVVDMGPDQGLQLAQELLADPAMLKAIGATQAAISSTEAAISRGAASAVYEGKYDTSKNFLSGLERQQAKLDKIFAELGKVLGQEAAWWIGHQRPPAPHHHHLRHKHEPGGSGDTRSLIHIDAMHVHNEADATMVAQRLSAMIRLHGAGFGGGFRP